MIFAHLGRVENDLKLPHHIDAMTSANIIQELVEVINDRPYIVVVIDQVVNDSSCRNDHDDRLATCTPIRSII